MATTIFYSWQSDLPRATNLEFLEAVLTEAVDLLAVGGEIAKSERHEGLMLDKDTKGVPGTPPITDTIFNKIANCAVFVPDMSFIGKTPKGRLLQNPNVLIEYGWALAKVGHARILPIVNTHYGTLAMDNLPFDMRHLRHPLTYALSESAAEEDKVAVKHGLVKQVSEAIRDILMRGDVSSGSAEPDLHVPVLSASDPSTFLREGESLPLFQGASDTNLLLPQNQHMYLRVMPVYATAPVSNKNEAKNFVLHGGLQPLGNLGGWTRGHNKHGAFVVGYNDKNVAGMTQLFLNKELWGIDCVSLDKKFLMQRSKVDYGYIPSVRLEMVFISALANFLSFCHDHLGLQPPLKIAAGVTQVEGYRMAVPHDLFMGKFDGRITDENIEWECKIDDLRANPITVLRPFFEHVWGECGLTRPDVETLANHY